MYLAINDFFSKSIHLLSITIESNNKGSTGTQHRNYHGSNAKIDGEGTLQQALQSMFYSLIT